MLFKAPICGIPLRQTEQTNNNDCNLQNVKYCVGKDVEKWDPSYIAGGMRKWWSHCGIQQGGSSKNM